MQDRVEIQIFEDLGDGTLDGASPVVGANAPLARPGNLHEDILISVEEVLSGRCYPMPSALLELPANEPYLNLVRGFEWADAHNITGH